MPRGERLQLCLGQQIRHSHRIFSVMLFNFKQLPKHKQRLVRAQDDDMCLFFRPEKDSAVANNNILEL